jgi:hypothetical protein
VGSRFSMSFTCKSHAVHHTSVYNDATWNELKKFCLYRIGTTVFDMRACEGPRRENPAKIYQHSRRATRVQRNSGEMCRRSGESMADDRQGQSIHKDTCRATDLAVLVILFHNFDHACVRFEVLSLIMYGGGGRGRGRGGGGGGEGEGEGDSFCKSKQVIGPSPDV